MSDLLALHDARVVRGGRTILHVDSLVIREGEHVAILGPNGAGKSTLIGLLTRDILPLWTDPPAVRFLGEERIAISEVRQLIGMVSAAWQDMVDVVLPAEQIVLGGFFGAVGVPRHNRPTAEQLARAREALFELGISNLAERTMNTLSTGEARRVLIARALVDDPRILVFDEPCAGLDPNAAWHVRDSLRRLAAGGHTIVLVTHHVEDIVAQIDRVVMLSDARIVADGPKAELLTGERLSGLFGVPLEVEERDREYRLW
jgi:iron complex transport system ATP-binding protein